MNYIKELYIDENLKNADHVLEAIRRKENVFNVYLICMDNLNNNVANIMSTYEAFSSKNEGREMTLIGVAYGRRGAYDLFKAVLEDLLEKGIEVDKVKDTLLQQ